MEEIWKDIPNYEGLYQASTMGRIKRLESKVWNRFDFITKKEHILKPRYTRKGYIHYALYKNGERKDFKCHWLILSTYIENKDNKPQINHINGKKDDNRLENLEYCTNEENQKHAYRIGLKKPMRGAKNPKARKVNQYDLKGEFIKQWNCINEAKRNLNILNAHIGECCKGTRKNAGDFKWRYVDE